jgi:predicted DsbA family dithiol-disulfide isomerase
MAVLTIWSDLRCPWAYVAAIRLRRMRDHMNADEVLFDFRAYPFELTEDGVPAERDTRNEIAVAAQLEHAAFSAYSGATWPHSYLAAFEAQKWGYALGQDVGEGFDLALRRGFFLHGHDISLRRELLEIAENEQLPVERLSKALDEGTYRSAVIADAAEANRLELEGSPQIYLPDGATHHNPGTTLRWVRGLPIVESDHPSVYEELIQVSAVEM